MRAWRLPDLGNQGQGWFLIQLVLFAGIALAGRLGAAWGGPALPIGMTAGLLLIVCGAILALRGLFDLRENLTPFPRPLAGARLVESGAYSLVRHPIYGGLILGAAGWGLWTASPLALLGAVVLAAFFNLKSRREEIWLADQFEEYDAYRSRTKRLLPWVC